MRQFLAIPLPDQLKDELGEIITPFRGIKGLKPVRKENLHLTLLFLGDTGSEEKFSELRKISFSPFTLTTTEIKLFPERKPRLIWLELEESEELNDLYSRIAAVFGVSEKLKSHITLARIKWLLPQDYRVVSEKIGLANPFEADFTVNCFNLYNSELQPRGPVYRVAETFMFSG
ncbi:MAG: RNA 2',3'-cyclic phosphodiesterase [Marinilabiliales bacterium]|nr:MAG: RNA 2',3'-cyclic phosphodiesterase [Marinilabiliales bacterium]